jgi:hypothetical protein
MGEALTKAGPERVRPFAFRSVLLRGEPGASMRELFACWIGNLEKSHGGYELGPDVHVCSARDAVRPRTDRDVVSELHTSQQVPELGKGPDRGAIP